MLNMNELKVVCNDNETAQIIAVSLANRQRHRAAINVRRLRHDIMEVHKNINLEHFDNFWKRLEDIGVGKLKKHIFALNYDLITLAADVVNASKGQVLKTKTVSDEDIAEIEELLNTMRKLSHRYCEIMDKNGTKTSELVVNA